MFGLQDTDMFGQGTDMFGQSSEVEAFLTGMEEAQRSYLW